MSGAGSGFRLAPSELHSSGDTLRSFGTDLTSAGTKLTSLGDSLIGGMKNDKSGIGPIISKALGEGSKVAGKVFSEGGRVSTGAGDRLHSGATNHTENESRITSSFRGIGGAGEGKGSGARTAPASTTATGGSGGGKAPSSGKAPSQGGGKGGGKNRWNPYKRPGGSGNPGGGGGGGHPGGGGGGNPGGGGGGGNPGGSDPRPHNFNPNISNDTHNHVTHGGWGSGGANGGHMLTSDLLNHPHPDQSKWDNGTLGYGAALGQGGKVDLQPNGVYKNPNPEIAYHTNFGGYHTKPVGKHTQFPEGMPPSMVHQIGQNAANSNDIKFWSDNDGGHWSATTTIPPGHASSGMPIKINGRYGRNGNVTTYFPSPNQSIANNHVPSTSHAGPSNSGPSTGPSHTGGPAPAPSTSGPSTSTTAPAPAPATSGAGQPSTSST